VPAVSSIYFIAPKRAKTRACKIENLLFTPNYRTIQQENRPQLQRLKTAPRSGIIRGTEGRAARSCGMDLFKSPSLP
jgi:hypothetical protein